MRLKLVLFSILTVAAFQNCGRVNVTEDIQTSLSSLSASLQFHEVTILVDVNQTKVVDLNQQMTIQGSVSLSENSVITRQEMAEGVIELSTNPKGRITFTPAYGFRGTAVSNLFLRHGENQIEVVKLNFEVRNPLRDIKPSLAVRAAECLLCHAQVKGDVISDFGYKSAFDTKGRDYFFTTRDGVNTYGYAPYHDANSPRNSGWSTATIKGNVIVPKVNLNSYADRAFLIARGAAQTLRDYIDQVIFDRATTGNRVDNVVEKSLVYIGAPSENSIKAAGRLSSSQRWSFLKNGPDAPELSGFFHFYAGGKDFYTNIDPAKLNEIDSASTFLRCEGDLFVDGVIWLRNLRIETEEGCRIHATGTVFITGPIEYVDESALTNLQIVSSRAIYLGAGICIDCYQGADGIVDAAADGEYGVNWTVSRAGQTYTAGIFRNRENMNTYQAEIAADFLKVSNASPVPPRPAAGVNALAYYDQQLKAAGIFLVDPKSPHWDQSATPYRRLLLNAPDVQSRYNGDFQGWVIAEFALWKLGSFSFKFDPVFKAVPIFPLMNFDEILKIED